MKTLQLFIGLTLTALTMSSCVSEEVYIEEPVAPALTLNQLLNSYDLWYIDINETLGFGETPFMEIAFTLSFQNGVVYANNNLVGLGSRGNGLGIDVGFYETYDMVLDVTHDIDGYQSFDVFQVDANTIELYNPFEDTSYFLNGYQRNDFDYDLVFYDNIHYFLQEYEAWEKTFTSQMGAINEFDNEHYLQFLTGNNDSEFRSSQDTAVNNPDNIFWDYTGVYGVTDVTGDFYLKTLTLDYDYFDNEYFELSVIDDETIELFHPRSETIYEFRGRGYIQYLRQTNNQGKRVEGEKLLKKRKKRFELKDNPRENNRV